MFMINQCYHLDICLDSPPFKTTKQPKSSLTQTPITPPNNGLASLASRSWQWRWFVTCRPRPVASAGRVIEKGHYWCGGWRQGGYSAWCANCATTGVPLDRRAGCMAAVCSGGTSSPHLFCAIPPSNTRHPLPTPPFNQDMVAKASKHLFPVLNAIVNCKKALICVALQDVLAECFVLLFAKGDIAMLTPTLQAFLKTAKGNGASHSRMYVQNSHYRPCNVELHTNKHVACTHTAALPPALVSCTLHLVSVVCATRPPTLCQPAPRWQSHPRYASTFALSCPTSH